MPLRPPSPDDRPAAPRDDAALHESEVRLALVMESIGEGFYEWDALSNTTRRSAQYEALLGFAPGEFPQTAAPWLERLHPEDAARVQAAMHAHLEGHTPRYEMEYRMRHRDGRWVWIHDRGRVVERDAEGRPLRMVGAYADITSRKEAEQALVESEARLADAQRIARIGSFWWDAPEDRQHWSAQSYAIFGVPAGSVVRLEDFFALVHPDDRARVEHGMREHVAARRTAWSEDYRIRRPDGEVRWIEGRANAVYDEAGTLLRLAGTNRDVTERVLLEARLRQAQKMEAVGQLAGGVAHDFNNLLTVIMGNVTLARQALPPESQPAADLDEALAAAQRAARLTQQLLAFGRRQSLRPEPLDVNRLLAGAGHMLRRVLPASIHLHVLPADGAPRVLADRNQLEQVLLNLVVNARDAIEERARADGLPHDVAEGSITLAVSRSRVRADATGALVMESEDAPLPDPPLPPPGHFVAIAVRDTGTGMDPETRARAAEPFFTTKPPGRGSGLGLAMVHGLVTQSGGGLAIESVQGRGTTVAVHLPLAPAEGDAAPPAADAAPPARVAAPAGRTVLVVEDEGAVRSFACRVLARDGHRVLEARHGRDAIEILAHEHLSGRTVDLLLTDIVMPEMGGRELIARVRARWPALPVIAMSGYAHAEHTREAPLGAPLLAKPFDADTLRGAVAEALSPTAPARD